MFGDSNILENVCSQIAFLSGALVSIGIQRNLQGQVQPGNAHGPEILGFQIMYGHQRILHSSLKGANNVAT